jgi:gluconokinase
MGVSGCGKSHVGALVAQGLGLPLVEGDEFHPEGNRARMRSGVALTDDDRAEWLDTLGAELQRRAQGAVLTCSALKVAYRQRLRSAVPDLRFAWLALDASAAQERVAKRGSHFFPAALVATQFEALQPPDDEPGVLRLDALRSPEELAANVVSWLK